MIVCVGLATRDLIYRVPALPTRDGRVVATERLVAGGGPAATAAVTIARLGIPVRFVGVIDGELEDVEVVHVPGRMACSTILVCDDARAIIAEPPPRFRCPPEALRDAEWIHVDHVGYAGLPRGPLPGRLSVDGGNSIPGLDLSAVDLYVPSEAADDGRRARSTVVTRGARGCVAYADGETITAAGHPAHVISTLGAGDVFHGALLASLARGLSLRDALPRANVCAALSCRALDGRSAVPGWEELERAVAGRRRREEAPR